MTKTTRLFFVTTALLCLALGNAVAEDKPEKQQAKPDVTNDQEDQSKPKPEPKEEPPSKNSSQSSAAKEEPDCN